MKSKIIILISLLLTLTVHIYAADYKHEADAASKAYSSGNYEEALAAYTRIEKQGLVSAGLYYDMGNTYVKTHDWGMAMLCFERALRLDPGNDRIENNISYVTSQVDSQNRADLKGKPVNVSADEPWFFRSIYNGLTIDVKSDVWAMFGSLSFVLFILFVADYIFTKQVFLRKIGFFGAIFMAGFTVVFLVLAFCSASENGKRNQGIIMASKIELLADPADNAKTTTTMLNRGTKVEIIKTEGGTSDHPEWYDVRLNSENAGWIKASDLEKI